MYVSDEVRRFLRATGPTHENIQEEMATYADERGFPIIGPEAGGVLQFLASVTDASRVFEFGSGFGYSAYWFLRVMPNDGEIVLTEVDADDLAMAEEFLDRAGLADRAIFEHGDAMEIVERYDDPFDVVLIDHRKERYAAAFDAVRDQIPPGAVVVADNIMRGPVRFEELLPYFETGEDLPADERARGIAEYVETVRAAEDFQTLVLPIGNGLALTTREQT